MPEQLTKHPEVTLQVLSSGAAQCGTGAPQDILKACPAARFCKLPGGELCVYGLPEAAQMTQLGPSDWRALVAPPPPPVAPAAGASAAWGVPGGLGLFLGLVLGYLAAVMLRRR